MEQRPTDWSEATSKAKGNLDHSDSTRLAHRIRNLALFNLAIDSKLRVCDLVRLHVGDIALGTRILPRATVMQQKTIGQFSLR